MGILTNGRVWRLYFQGALSVAEDFFEIDLGKVLAVEGCDFDLLDRRPAVFGDDRSGGTMCCAFRHHLRSQFLPAGRG